MTHEAGHNFRIKYDWFQNTDKESLQFTENDTGALRDWTVLKIEGEPDIVPTEAVPINPKDKGKPA